MKFTKKAMNDGWTNTAEDSSYFMKNEVLWMINSEAYKDVDEFMKEFADYIEEFTADELRVIEDAIDDRLIEIREEEEAKALEEELLAIEWEQELAYMKSEYFRSVMVV